MDFVPPDKSQLQAFALMLGEMYPYEMRLKDEGKDLPQVRLKLARPEEGLPTSPKEAREWINKTKDFLSFVAPETENNALVYCSDAWLALIGLPGIHLKQRTEKSKKYTNMKSLTWRIASLYFPKNTKNYAPQSEYLTQELMLGMLASRGLYQLPAHTQIVDLPAYIRKGIAQNYKRNVPRFNSVEAVAKHLFSSRGEFFGTLITLRPEEISKEEYGRLKKAKRLISPTLKELVEMVEERREALLRHQDNQPDAVDNLLQRFAMLLEQMRPYEIKLKKKGEDLKDVRLKLAYPKKGLPTSLEEMSERINDKKTEDMLQFFAPETRHNEMEDISEAAKKLYGFQPFPDGKNAENVALLVANTYVPKDTKGYAPQQEFSQQQTMLRMLAKGGLYQLPNLLLILDQDAQKSRSDRAKWSDLYGSQYLAVRSQPDHLFSKGGEFLGTLISLQASDISKEEYNNAKTAKHLVNPTPQEIFDLVMERRSTLLPPSSKQTLNPRPQPKSHQSRQEAIIHVGKPENAEKMLYVLAPGEENNQIIAGSFAFWSFCQKIGLIDFMPGSSIVRLTDYLAEKFLPEDSRGYHPRQAFLKQQQMLGLMAKNGKYKLPDAMIALDLGTEFITLKFQGDHIFSPSSDYECTIFRAKAAKINERKYKQLYKTQKLVIPTPEDILAMFQRYLDDQ